MLWEGQFEETLLELGWEKGTELGMSFVYRKQELYVDDIKMAGKTKNWLSTLILMNPHHFLTMYIWDAINVNANRMKLLLRNIQRCVNHVFLLEQLKKLPGCETPHAKTVAWSYEMEGHARKCVERHCELANKKVEQSNKVSCLCLDDHQFKKEELESVVQLSIVCSQIVLKMLVLGTNR